MSSIMDNISERTVIAATLAAITLLSFWVFSKVIWTVFFAVTIAYVLQPLNQQLREKGASDTLSSAISTLVAVVTLLTLAAPFLIVLYRRRDILIDFIQDIPQNISLEFLGFEFDIEISTLVEMARDSVTEAAITVAQGAPSLLLKFVLLLVLVFALLRNSRKIKETFLGVFPERYEKMFMQYNDRAKQTITGLYIVQLSTAVLTFIVAMPVFYFLGYEPFISLALIAGLLQFIPVLGPTLLILILAGFEIILGDVFTGIIVLISGLLLIAALPDLVLRPHLADKTTGMPASLYFLGFIGGILTLGAIGIIVGPFIIALFLETVRFAQEYEN